MRYTLSGLIVYVTIMVLATTSFAADTENQNDVTTLWESTGVSIEGVDLQGSVSADGHSFIYTDWSTDDLTLRNFATGVSRHLTNKSAWTQSNEFAVLSAFSQTESAGPRNVDEQLLVAKEDLAGLLRVETDEIEVDTVRQVHWRSGAAGCPEPGMSYTMAIVPGVLILLRADGEVYRYHARRNGTPFYCPTDRVEAPVSGQGQELI